jgi:hypothetical protein
LKKFENFEFFFENIRSSPALVAAHRRDSGSFLLSKVCD